MRVKDIKQQIEFQTDALFQAGYDMGWNAVLVELDELSNKEWNIGNRVTADVIRRIVKELGASND